MVDLGGLKVVVTRPSQQSEEILLQLDEAGASTLKLPLLEIVKSNNTSMIHRVLTRLDRYDSILFVSTNAVRFALADMQDGHLSQLEKANVWAIGHATASALQSAGINTIQLPVDGVNSEALLQMPQMQKVTNQQILVFQGGNGRSLLYDTLSERGAQVDCLDVYQRQAPIYNKSVVESLRHDADVIMITSGEALMNLVALSKTAQLDFNELVLLVGSHRIAIIAGNELQHGGLIVANNPTDKAMMNALNKWVSGGKICQMM